MNNPIIKSFVVETKLYFYFTLYFIHDFTSRDTIYHHGIVRLPPLKPFLFDRVHKLKTFCSKTSTVIT